jgi:hypothetical protein
MGLINSIFRSPIIKAVNGSLDDLDYEYSKGDSNAYEAFKLVKAAILKIVNNEPEKVERYITDNERNNITPRIWAISSINNIAGDWVESGRYHLYRGVLNSLGSGLLALFTDTNNKLVDLRSIDPGYAKDQVTNIKKSVGMAG